MIKSCVFVLALIFTFTFVNGQQADTTRYKVRYGLTGIYNRTDDDRSFVINNALTLAVTRKKLTLNSNSTWVYGQQGDNLTNNDITSGLNLDVLKDVRKLYYWGLANYTNSFSLKINYQFQAGVGVGYNISNTDRFELVVSDGILAEASDLDLETGRDKYRTVRNSLRVKHRIRLTDVLVVEGSHFWQPSFANAKDYIIRSTTALSLKLRSWLSVTGALTYNRISRTNRENLLINFGFVAENTFRGRVRGTSDIPVAPVAPVE